MKKHKAVWGLDLWSCPCTPKTFFTICKQAELEVYDVEIQRHKIVFYAPILTHYHVMHAFSSIEHITTTGIAGYVFRSLRKPGRVLGIILAIVLWYGLSHMIFTIEIKGEHEQSRTLIARTLHEMGYQTPFYANDIQDLKRRLKKQLEQDIAWLEIEKRGSRYSITYTPKEFASLTELGNDALIAKQDGVIQRFEIEHGNKVKQVNEFVHAGDVLVSNVLEDSAGGKKEVFVKGRVFAYTWKDVTVSMPSNKGVPEAFAYFDLLLSARQEVSKDFHKDDRIHKENILQFQNDMGTIEMVVHYTLVQDITTP